MKSYLVPFVGVGLLAGCVNTQDPELTPRVEAIEAQLSGQCSDANQLLAAQNAQIEQMVRSNQALQQELTTRFGTQDKRIDETQSMLRKVDNDLAKESARSAEQVNVPVIVNSCDLNASSDLNGKSVFGEVEWVELSPPGKYFEARVDTGATSSSVHATDVVEFERDGKKWVRFNISHSGDEELILERRIKRFVLIRQSNLEETIRRPVVELLITIGSIKTEAEFTLADRGQLEYPILLGREFLKDLVVVDVSQQYIHERPKDAEVVPKADEKPSEKKKSEEKNKSSDEQ